MILVHGFRSSVLGQLTPLLLAGDPGSVWERRPGSGKSLCISISVPLPLFLSGPPTGMGLPTHQACPDLVISGNPLRQTQRCAYNLRGTPQWSCFCSVVQNLNS